MGTGDLEPWVVEYEKVPLRGAPSIHGTIISLLTRGDQLNVAELISVNNEDWARLPKGAVVVKDKAEEPHQDQPPSSFQMEQDAYVLINHPKYGPLIKKKDGVAVQEDKQEGFLSKPVMQRILAKSSNSKELIIPLEAKTWSEAEFELFVMSGGVVRPRWCSVPDMNEMVNNNMKDDEVELALAQAAEWIATADAVLVGSGAGMGVDSGLSTFRGGKAGVWPALEVVGLAYEEICDPKWFKKEPALAWAFWNFCHEAYQETKPHRGYEVVRQWASKAPLGAFSFTSNIDSHWAASGWPKRRIIEVHGAVAWHQCAKACCPDVWEARADLGLVESPVTHRVEGQLPKCPKCGGVARPCVQMFGGDSGFAKSRRAVQINRYDAWLKKMEARPDAKQLRLVCLELGCGLTVPTVRRELEAVLGRFPNARLVRVNPENPGLSKELQDVGLSLPLPAGKALASLEPQVAAIADAEKEMANFVFWDGQGQGVEFTAPVATPLMRLLRLAEAEDGVEVEFTGKNIGFTVSNLVQLQITQDLGPQDRVPRNFFWNLNKQSPEKDAAEEDTESTKTAVLTCKNVNFKNGMSQRLAARITEVGEMLDDMNQRFHEQAYQDEVRMKQDRRGVLQMVRSVHLEVLPKFGIRADDAGVWLMQALTGLGMIGRSEISQKAGYSMEVSYMNAANLLPAVVKKEPEKPPPPPPEPLEVLLTQLGEDVPATLKLDAMTDTTVAELREKVGVRVGLKESKLKQVKFLMKVNGSSGSFATMKEHEAIKKDIFVVGLDRWVHPDEEPPFEVELLIKNAIEDDDEVKITAMSNMTLAQVREAWANHLGKPELTKKTKFVRKAANAFSAHEDSERLGSRKTLLVMGLEGRMKDAAPPPEQRPSGPGGGASSSSRPRPRPQQAAEGPPDLTLEEGLALQRDLIDGFEAEEFQNKLKAIMRSLAAGELNERKFNVERTKLFLSVQKEVLPKFGFHGSQKGVFDMMNVFQKNNFDASEEFGKNGWWLNCLLYPTDEEPQPPPQPEVAAPSSSSKPGSGRSGKMLVTIMSADITDQTFRISMEAKDTVFALKVKLLESSLPRAHYYVYMRIVDGFFQEMQDPDLVEEDIWAHDPAREYRPGLLQGGQRQRPPGGTPSRPLQVEGTGLWPAASEMYHYLSNNGILEPHIANWMTTSFKSMSREEAAAWLALQEDHRWGSILWMLRTPLFTRCREDWKFAERTFNLPNFKAPMRVAKEDPQLREVDSYHLMSRWFVDDGTWNSSRAPPAPAASSAADERMLISVVRLGDDDLIRWEIVVQKGSTVADLRRRIVEAYGLDAKAAKQMRFAMQKGSNFVSMVDSEKIKRAMAVRGLEGDWPPPSDPDAAEFIG